MLSNKWTFSLTSLVVMLALALLHLLLWLTRLLSRLV